LIDKYRNRFGAFAIAVYPIAGVVVVLHGYGLAEVARVGNGGVAGGNAYITIVKKERERERRRERERKSASTGRLGGLHNAASCQGVDFMQHYVSLPFGFLPLYFRRCYQLRCSCLCSFNARDHLHIIVRDVSKIAFVIDNEIFVSRRVFIA